MKKFLLSTVFATIAIGFYHASSVLDSDVVANSPERNLAFLKGTSGQEVGSKVTTTAADVVEEKVKEVSGVDMSEGIVKSQTNKLAGLFTTKTLLRDSALKSLTNGDLSLRSQSKEEEKTKDSSDKEDDSEIKFRKEIVEIYKEAPHIFDPELLKKYLDEESMSEEDFVRIMCENLE
jgi:hypothetical protein